MKNKPEGLDEILEQPSQRFEIDPDWKEPPVLYDLTFSEAEAERIEKRLMAVIRAKYGKPNKKDGK